MVAGGMGDAAPKDKGLPRLKGSFLNLSHQMLPWRQQSKHAFRWAASQETTVRDNLEQTDRISIRARRLAVNRVLQHALLRQMNRWISLEFLMMPVVDL
jgi:hypothetical protein